jgi:ABC-type proline/glycine betaine transport system permease subunit
MMGNYLRFDFGESYFRSVSVIDLVLEKMPVSISLGLWSTLLAYLVSIPLGVRKAVRDGTPFDTWTSGVVIVAYAIPGFLFAILLLVLSGRRLLLCRWFPLRGLVSDNWEELSIAAKIADYFWHITLPVTASTIAAFATLTLLTKNSFLDQIKMQYVTTARAKGLPESRVLFGHVFRNAMLIVIAGFPAPSSRSFSPVRDHRDDLFARRAGTAGFRGGGGARLSCGVRHALRVWPDRAGGAPADRSDVCLDRSPDRFRHAGGLSDGGLPPRPAPLAQFPPQPPRILVTDSVYSSCSGCRCSRSSSPTTNRSLSASAAS